MRRVSNPDEETFSFEKKNLGRQGHRQLIKKIWLGKNIIGY